MKVITIYWELNFSWILLSHQFNEYKILTKCKFPRWILSKVLIIFLDEITLVSWEAGLKIRVGRVGGNTGFLGCFFFVSANSIWFDWSIVFNATFSNISAISCWPVLVMEEAGVPRENLTDHGQATGKLYHLRPRVECTLFCNLQSRREPTPYWW